MDIWEELAEARKELKLADHMVYVTYKLLNDRKIMLSVARHINSALNNTIFAFLKNELRFKRIYHLPENEHLRLKYFLRDYSEQFALNFEGEEMIIKLDNLRSMKSGGYNIQEGSVIHIVNGCLRVETLSVNMIKKYLSNARELINNIEKLVRTDYGTYAYKS
ncbi:MAG: hypothetical protein GON13_03500 [Nanoarchaeota archaeon]|nr:hypothetical protein [Nanoarchaeota archaeon]